MPLTDLNLRPVYNHSNCPDMIAGLYEPLLREAIRYDRTTYTFTAKGLIAAAAGTAGLIRNGGRIRLICDHTVRPDILQALHDGQIQAETALQQTHNREDLLLTQPDDLSSRPSGTGDVARRQRHYGSEGRHPRTDYFSRQVRHRRRRRGKQGLLLRQPE